MKVIVEVTSEDGSPVSRVGPFAHSMAANEFIDESVAPVDGLVAKQFAIESPEHAVAALAELKQLKP